MFSHQRRPDMQHEGNTSQGHMGSQSLALLNLMAAMQVFFIFSTAFIIDHICGVILTALCCAVGL